MHKDITSQVSFADNDGELLPLTKCICGKEYEVWDFVLNTDIYDSPIKCDACGRRMYFEVSIKVYEIGEPRDSDKNCI